jgi:hypothetical protein
MATALLKSLSPDWTDASRLRNENVTSPSEKPSRQFGLEPSGDRRDIGYAHSGVQPDIPHHRSAISTMTITIKKSVSAIEDRRMSEKSLARLIIALDTQDAARAIDRQRSRGCAC